MTGGKSVAPAVAATVRKNRRRSTSTESQSGHRRVGSDMAEPPGERSAATPAAYHPVRTNASKSGYGSRTSDDGGSSKRKAGSGSPVGSRRPRRESCGRKSTRERTDHQRTKLNAASKRQ